MFILVSNKVFIENKMNVNKITDVSTMTIFLQFSLFLTSCNFYYFELLYNFTNDKEVLDMNLLII